MSVDHQHPLGETCALCGSGLADVDRHVRFELPEPVLTTEDRERTPGTWLSHHDAVSSVMLQVPWVGAFVRALLPVQLDDGSSVTYGVWVGISPEDLQQSYSVWWAPEYSSLQLSGLLANIVPPGGTLGAAVELSVRDVEQTPYVTESSDERVSGLLSTVQPAAEHAHRSRPDDSA